MTAIKAAADSLFMDFLAYLAAMVIDLYLIDHHDHRPQVQPCRSIPSPNACSP
jgi:hypothetical protein